MASLALRQRRPGPWDDEASAASEPMQTHEPWTLGHLFSAGRELHLLAIARDDPDETEVPQGAGSLIGALLCAALAQHRPLFVRRWGGHDGLAAA